MSDNPFAEPSDDDRTVIRPMPGGRRSPPTPRPVVPTAPPQPAAAPAELRPAPLPAADPAAPPAVSTSPLTAAASPLLQLLARLRAMRRAPDPQALRERVGEGLRSFERQARDAGIAMELLRPAHFALCASLDDVVLNTPWGATSGWADQTLVAALHPGARGVDQFFDQLRQMRRDPGKFLPVIELMYLCLALGFMGRYRQARGEGELEQVRAETHAVMAAQRQTSSLELSRRWQGIAAPYQVRRRGVPVWVGFAAAAVACGGLLLWASTGLNAASDGVQAQALATPPTHMPQVTRAAIVLPVPPPPAPPEPTVLDRLRTALQPEMDRGAVVLLGTAASPVLRVPEKPLFAAASAKLEATGQPLLERIANALHAEAGAVRVIAYTDNQPIRTVKFPSNFQLSAAQANVVRDALARLMGEPNRISSEGRADADPIAPNTTAEGRAQNRRIEIVLHYRG